MRHKSFCDYFKLHLIRHSFIMYGSHKKASRAYNITWFLRKSVFEYYVAKKLFKCLSVWIFLSRFWPESIWERHNTTYLAQNLPYYLQKPIFFEAFHLFLPLDWSSPVLKMAAVSSRFLLQVTIAQHTSALKHCRPRTSDTANCAFRNVSGSTSELIYWELAIFSQVSALWPFSGSIPTWIFDSLNCWL